MPINIYGMSVGIEPEAKNEEIPAWKALDEACRKWAILSGHEKDLERYEINAAAYR